MHLSPIPDGVVDCSLPERVDADAACSQPLGVDSRRQAVFFHEPPGGFAVEVSPHQSATIGAQRSKECPFLVVSDPCPLQVRPDCSCGIKEDLPPFLVTLLGHTEVMLHPIGL